MKTQFSLIDIISPELADEIGLHPIPDGAVIQFKLGNAQAEDPFSTKKISTPKHFSTPGRAIIRDPYDKKSPTKEIQNIASYTPVTVIGQGTVMEPVLDSVKFDSNGLVTLHPGDENTYWFLLLNDKRGDKPGRNRKVAIKYHLVDTVREAAVLENNYDYKVMAANIVRDASDDDELLVTIAQRIERVHPKNYKFDISDIRKLKLSLQTLADKDPIDLLDSVQEPKSYARLLVDYAVSRNQLFFDDHENNLTWKFKKTPGEKGKATIHKVTKNKTRLKELIEFLTSDKGNEHLVELKRLNDTYYQK